LYPYQKCQLFLVDSGSIAKPYRNKGGADLGVLIDAKTSILPGFNLNRAVKVERNGAGAQKHEVF
jgi:hypothetical protein